MATVKTLLPKKQAEESRIRIAAYCRVSTDSADQKDSFDAQVEYYTRYIGENPNWALADIYADQGISGTSMAKRDEFNRMIADCQRGKIWTRSESCPQLESAYFSRRNRSTQPKCQASSCLHWQGFRHRMNR